MTDAESSRRDPKREEILEWLGDLGDDRAARRAQQKARSSNDTSWVDEPHADGGERGDTRDSLPEGDVDLDDVAQPFSHPIIIVGGGRVGRALLRKFPTTVVLETDPTKIQSLRKEFGPQRVYHGSGSDPMHLAMAGIQRARALVAATNSDETNYKACLAGRDAKVKKLIARVEYLDQTIRFKTIGASPVTAPVTVCVSIITNLLSPDRRTIGEGVIPDGAPTVGVAIQDLHLPSGALIVSILRGDDLLTPDPQERLEVGDVITLMTEKEDLAETLAQVTGRNVAINPINRIYVPLRDAGTIKTAFREAFVLAGYADAEIFLVAPEGTQEVIAEAQRLCEISDIPVVAVTLPEKDFARRFVALVQAEDTQDAHGGLKDHLFFEMVAIDAVPTKLWHRLLGRRLMDRLLRQLDHPVLIARNLKPYKNILLVLENTSRASMTVAHTIDLALLYGSNITALLPEQSADESAYKLLRYLKRTGRIYGVEVEERFVVGNPTLEYIQEVKSGKYDLIVVDWQARNVKRDILRRVVRYGPRSTLVIP